MQDCEVFSYSPETEFDPHANDDDSEDNPPYVHDPDADSAEEDDPFIFDDYDVDESGPTERTGNSMSPLKPTAEPIPSQAYKPSSKGSRSGALLWSSHWFFLNRKLKRILFVSIWARSSGISRSVYADDEEEFLLSEYEGDDISSINERFVGWEGATGAGARALGLVVTASA